MAYTLSVNKNTVDEGSSVIITLDGTGLPDGSLVPFTISGTNITNTDFLGLSGLTGNFLITSNRGRIVLNPAQDFRTEGPETFILSLDGRSESIGVVINDTSLTPAGQVQEYYITSDLSTVFEGGTVTFNISAINVAAGTAVPYEIYGLKQNRLVSGTVTGSLVFQANTGYDTIASSSFSILENFKTDGDTNMIMVLKPTSSYTLRVSSSVTVIDSSKENSAKYSVSTNKYVVPEGDPITFTVYGINVNAGDTVKWEIAPTSDDGNPTEINPASDITLSDFTGLSALNGEMQPFVSETPDIVSRITFNTRDDYVYEQNEYFVFRVYNSVGTWSSPIIKIQDSGHTLVSSDAVYTGNAIVSFLDSATLSANVGGIATKPGYWKNTQGQLDDQMYIQGRRLYETEESPVYYQPFSYVIRSSQSIDVWADSVKDILHPAGFTFFSEINNENDFENVMYAGVRAVSDSDLDIYTPITTDKIGTAVNSSSTNLGASAVKSLINLFATVP